MLFNISVLKSFLLKEESVNRRIVVSVTNDLVTDQRVHRACTALHDEGYNVTLVGRRLPLSAPVTRPYRTVRMRLLFEKKAVFYAEFNIRLFIKLLFSRADCFYANDTDTLPANYMAACLRRKPLFFDAHEMFPEVPELVGRQRVKRFWTWIEDRIFPKIATKPRMAAVTVCGSIADIYKERYGLDMAVVRNVPMERPAPPRGDKPQCPVLLYQGAVNVGRGIEWIADAMQYLPDYRFVVAGVGDKYEELRQRYKQDNITFVGRLEPDRLYELTTSATLGMSLLENRGLNYYYSLPNRLADFVQARVPVLATDFPEIRNVVEGYGVGTLVPPQPFDTSRCESQPPDPHAMAQTIRNAVEYWSQMPADEKKRRFDAAAKELSWNNDKTILINQISKIL